MASTATDSPSPRNESGGGQTEVESTDRTVQYKLNAQSLRLFGLHRDVNDAHCAGANRLQNNKQPFCTVPERGCPTLGDSCCFSSPGAAAGRVAASATNDAAEHARVDEPLRVGEERQEREEEDGAVGLARRGRDATSQGWRVGVGRLEVQVPECRWQREPDDEEGQRGRTPRRPGCEVIQRLEALPGTNDDLEGTYGFVKEMSGVRSVESGDGVEARVKLHQKYSQRTMSRMMRLLMECMHPKEVKGSELVQAILQWDEVEPDDEGSTRWHQHPRKMEDDSLDEDVSEGD